MGLNLKGDFADAHWSVQAREILNNLRVIPRFLIITYGVVCYQAFEWFISLETPTTAQVSFTTAIWGAAAVWFGMYVNSGNRKAD